jgi:hypothetical protein
MLLAFLRSIYASNKNTEGRGKVLTDDDLEATFRF